ncbi:MAG: ABC transporter substrate-binding protein, partial [Candidatus Heimdallarchaeaceae archaeon]
VSEFADNYFWLKDIQIDNSDNFSFYITVDGNEKTPELEPYAPFLNKLNIPCLPEFFLNSTSLSITNTSGNIPLRGLFEGIEDTIEWKDFDISSFGCGKYLLDYYVENFITVLKASSNWHEIGAIDGMYHDLSIETIKIKVLMDTAPKISEFLAGRLDIVKIKYESSFFNNLEKDPLFRCHKLVSNSFSILIFNLRRPFVGGTDNFIFLDTEGKENYTKGVAVRKAMCYAIDREEINQALHGGNFMVLDHPIPEIHKNYRNPDIIKYSHDIDKALEWLDPRYNLNLPKPTIPNLLETLLIIGGGIILIGAIPTFFITKGLLEYRRSKKRPSETSTNKPDSVKDM